MGRKFSKNETLFLQQWKRLTFEESPSVFKLQLEHHNLCLDTSHFEERGQLFAAHCNNNSTQNWTLSVGSAS